MGFLALWKSEVLALKVLDRRSAGPDVRHRGSRPRRGDRPRRSCCSGTQRSASCWLAVVAARTKTHFSEWNLYGMSGEARPGRTLCRSGRVVVYRTDVSASLFPLHDRKDGFTLRSLRWRPPASRYWPWTEVMVISSPAWFARRTWSRFFEWPFCTPVAFRERLARALSFNGEMRWGRRETFGDGRTSTGATRGQP